MILNRFQKLGILVICCSVLIFSCSKEDEEVTPAQFESPNFDQGHLVVKILNSPALIDSIEYANISKGITNTIDHSGMVYDASNNLSYLSVPFASGNNDDQVQCCVYINGPTSVGVAFENIPSDSIPTTFTSSNSFCQGGNY